MNWFGSHGDPAHMKSIHSVAAVLILGLSATSLPATEWYVATTGDDSHPGSKAEPFATLARAQQAARQRGSQPATILLRGGTYYLDSPIVLTAADSGTAAAPVLTISALCVRRSTSVAPEPNVRGYLKRG